MIFAFLDMGFSGNELLMIILAFALAIMIALVFHEWAHAYAAYKSGDPTAKMMGRMTLNPAKHVQPMGLLSFVFIGIGWAKPVPVNPFNYRNFRRGNFWVSIAGVLTNFILGFFASLFLFMMWHFGDPNANLGLFFLSIFFEFTMVINISLMLFNLIPVPPLDGYNLMISLTKPNNRYMNWARQNQHWLMIAVLMLLIFTGALMNLREGIIWLFNSLWSWIF